MLNEFPSILEKLNSEMMNPVHYNQDSMKITLLHLPGNNLEHDS